MQQQNYRNHVRFYPAHHFIFYPLILILLGTGIYGWCKQVDVAWLWIVVIAIAILIGWSSFMMRQHYALIIQNRVIRLEMRFRYFTLTQQPFDTIEKHLSFGQIAALRFAGDGELIELIDRTLKEELKPDQIKRAIKNWQADFMRV